MQCLIDAIDKADAWEPEKSINRGEFLKVAGETDLNVYFILNGCLKLCIADGGHEHVIRFGYQYNLVTALDSYLSEKPSDLYIQAIRKTSFKVISKLKLESIIHGSKSLRLVWIQLMEQLIFEQLEREKDILIQSPEKRYKRVLNRSPNLFQEVPHKYIASYLRMTPETLSRLKK